MINIADPVRLRRIAHARLMAEECRRSDIGSEAAAAEWEDRAWRLEHGMEEDDG